MKSLWDLTEKGLLALDSALAAMATGLDSRTSSPGPTGGDPEMPLHHPDDATSRLANDALRSLKRVWWAPELWGGTAIEVLGRSFELGARGLPQQSPAGLATLPLRLPLSWARLGVQEALRASASARVVPPRRMADFLGFVIETFSDLDIYFTLRYQQELDHWRERLRRHPGDARARLSLGRAQMKCGHFDLAADTLRQIDEGSPAIRAEALYLASVASHRAGAMEDALDYGRRCLELDPSHERARFWLFLSAESAGGYPRSVSPRSRLQVRDGRAPTPVRYEDVTRQIGLDKVSGGRGTAVADFFGDGLQHVVIAGAHSGLSLFRNRGDGTFDDASGDSGLQRCVYGFAVAAGDYDNDGLADLFVSSLGFYNGRSRLFHNEGGGIFRDVTREAGLEDWGPAFTATWVDYDNDGHLDLFVTHNLGGLFDRKVPNRLYRNNGDGTFTDVTREAGLETPWSTIGACWGDFRNVGLQDLFVSSLGRAQLFRNRGDGTFEDVSSAAGLDAPAIGSVALACDLDDDGWLDIVQATYSRTEEAIFTLQHGHGPGHGSPLRLWRNRRDGTFENVSAAWDVDGCWGTMSLAVGDFENRGRQGFLLGNGDPGIDRTEASVLLSNDGRRLSNVTFTAGLPFVGKGHGVNMADLSGNGRLHLLVASGGLYPGDLASTEVYRPAQRPGHYLGVRLVGTRSNRDAIGARLALEVGGRLQHRLVSGGSGFGCLPLQQHFGLGDSERVGRLEVRWPSGVVSFVDGLPVDTTIEITEGRSGWRPARAGGARA